MKTVSSHAEDGIKVIAGGLYLGLFGCPVPGNGPSDPPPEPTPVVVSAAVECSAPTLPPSTCDEICPPTHQIGPCGASDERVTTVDDPAGGGARSVWNRTQLGIDGYCSYVLEQGDPSLVRADWQRDCPLGPAGSELDGALESMAENFLDGAAGVSGSGLNVDPYPQWAGESPEIMVAVVDTAVEPEPEEAMVELEGEAGRHGRTMAAIVRRIACGPTSRSSCPIVVRSFVGLPLLRDGKEGPKGGVFGRQSHLARGIQAAIDEWEELVEDARARANPTPKLIINLSVGWEPGCGDPSGNEAELVRNQLRRVQGNGSVIVLAASGNRATDSAAVGFMGPALWERDALLYGVTPLDDRSQSLVTFRPGSNAQLAARGYMAVVRDTRLADDDPDEGGVYGPISGSSVSTAVVAGVAARTWVGSDATADQLMARLWQNGEPRNPPVAADSYWSSPPTSERLNETEQHEISLCRSLGGPNPGSCSAEHDAKVEAAAAFWSEASGLSIDSASVTTTGEGSCSDECIDTDCARTIVLTTAGGTTPSPIPSTSGFVVPQPSVPPCPTCYVKVNASPSSAHLRLDSAYSSYASSLQSTTIQLWNSSNATETHVYTGLTLSSSSWTTLTDADFADVAGYPTTKGYISMVFLENGTPFTVGNDLLIVTD